VNEAIEIEKLSKSYRGRRGIGDVSFSVPEGALFRFIGPNGAGKTTTIRILLGLLQPNGGSARLFGFDATTDGPRARSRVGYVPGETNLYPRMRGAPNRKPGRVTFTAAHTRRRTEDLEDRR
jgi:ABC-2 type transport system ATP-binding protein